VSPIGRAPFAVAGLLLLGVKLTLDRLLTENVFGRTWSPSIYLAPLGRAARVDALHPSESRYVAALVALAVPFVAAGTWLTLRRLRAVGWSPWLVVLFFVPLANLAFFAVLCVVPSRGGRRVPDRLRGAWQTWLPASPLGAALTASVAVALLGFGFVLLSTRVLADYGWGVFVAMPFVQGMLAVWLTGARAERAPSFAASIAVGALSVAVTGALLLAFLVEGVVCLAMAFPLALVLGVLGAAIGRAVLTLPVRRAACLVAAAGALPFALLGALPSPRDDAPRYAVVSRVVVDAPPERVWPHVVAFPPLAEPQDPLFRSGIAYPRRARIVGRGPGAIRYCEFSTGTFVEPIRVWDAPHRLAFGVAHNPPPMREASWAPIATRHLTGFLIADAGEFRLEPLPGGRTELIGTTWYRHNLYPAAYWRIWSDAIIHRIHVRVLEHVAQLSTERG
jgi:hypothetical protein